MLIQNVFDYTKPHGVDGRKARFAAGVQHFVSTVTRERPGEAEWQRAIHRLHC